MVFEVEIVVNLEETIVGIEIEKTGGLGDNQDWETEEWELDKTQVLDWDQLWELILIEIE